MPKKKAPAFDLISATLGLAAQNGYSNLTFEMIGEATGSDVDKISSRYDTPNDIVLEAFRTGHKRMETKIREEVSGDISAHLALIFDGLLEDISPWGTELYFNMLLQATEDEVLREMVKRSSERMQFAVKAFLLHMVSMSIIEELPQVDKVIEELVASFIESIADTASGKKMEDIRKNWIPAVPRGCSNPRRRPT